MTLASQIVYTVLAAILRFGFHAQFPILAATQRSLSAQPAKAAKGDKYRHSDRNQDQTKDDVTPRENWGLFQYRPLGSHGVCLQRNGLGRNCIRGRCNVVVVVVKVLRDRYFIRKMDFTHISSWLELSMEGYLVAVCVYVQGELVTEI